MVDLFDRSSSVDFKKDYEIRREEIRKEKERQRIKKRDDDFVSLFMLGVV